MNRFLAGTAGLFLAMLFVAINSAAQSNTFKGEITDDKLNCIQTPMKVPAGVTGKTACVLYWVDNAQPRGKYVLYDAATKTTYQLDDQDLVQPYVGAKVEVAGTLNSANKTIKVTGITVDEQAYKTGGH